MDTRKTIGHDAAVQQVCAVIESLDREGSTPIYAGDAQADFRILSITTGEGEAIRRLVQNEDATHAIEIGLAYGLSA